MRLRTLGIAAALTAALYQTSFAVKFDKNGETGRITAIRAPRSAVSTTWKAGPAHTPLANWTVMYDADTDVPLRMYGPAILTSGSVSNPAIAENAARQFLQAHIATLAPGSAMTDFTVFANELLGQNDIRTVIFQQHVGGVAIHEAYVIVKFKADRLGLVGSTAMPNVTVAANPNRVVQQALGVRAISWLAESGIDAELEGANALAAPRIILPTVHKKTGAAPDITYTVVEQVAVKAKTGMGRWTVWLDATTGAPVARQSHVYNATGTVNFNAPNRYPGGGYSAKPASFATHTIDGTSATANAAGVVTWNGAAASSVALKLSGTYARINTESGTLAADTLALQPNGAITWTKSTDEVSDAQLSSYVHTNIVKEFVRNGGLGTLTPRTTTWINARLTINVNIQDQCNAGWDGQTINFLRRGSDCENTGLLADVIYHEFGHGLHDNSNPMGITNGAGSLSEGSSDFLSALITHDAGLGRGFFFNNQPLRNLDPAVEKHWPEDAGEVHDEGEIIGGTMWDMSKNLLADLGETQGWLQSGKIYYGVIQSATDLPSTFMEALFADDDDGDISNGTPNKCAIVEAWDRHGLADASAGLSVGLPTRDKFNVAVEIASNSVCGGAVTGASLEWKLRGGTVATVPMTASGNGFEGDIPSQPDGSVVQYKVVVTTAEGSTSLPLNPADPFYEFYVGATEEIYSEGFESGFNGWAGTLGWGAGVSQGQAGDPTAAHSGNNVLGLRLDGAYTNNTNAYVESPEIDLGGETAVRLQLWRWLGVEDGVFDQARILVNGTQVWTNYASPSQQGATTNHKDAEWRFVDIDLAPHIVDGKVKLRFELQSDDGLELAGWNLDDVTVVKIAGPAVTCGNGEVDSGETCDDGNRIDGDGCDANCSTEDGGDGGDGDGTTDGDGGDGDDETGCCSANPGPSGASALALLTLGLVIGSRKRRRK
jgi:cysteine-rich repeat protein